MFKQLFFLNVLVVASLTACLSRYRLDQWNRP